MSVGHGGKKAFLFPVQYITSRQGQANGQEKDRLCGLFFLQFWRHLYDFASLVVAALFAGPVWEAIGTALGALGGRDGFHLEEFARAITAMMGMSLFRESHRIGELAGIHYKQAFQKASTLYQSTRFLANIQAAQSLI
jgi:hypothetical protein